ncbi:hypothetical protein Y1Q_0022567 [Alligator mississippiensis]|uniref:Uncharacterized protein n=1 Tax=Alligator mississippiensis TaxID=8496 RepID=A0A151NQA3_ALLMI|nr:hypothetical protein Y1Q_0022567 [Alligator mississippiensis]
MLTAVEDWNPPPKVLHTVPGEELPLNEIHSQPLRPCSELRMPRQTNDDHIFIIEDLKLSQICPFQITGPKFSILIRLKSPWQRGWLLMLFSHGRELNLRATPHGVQCLRRNGAFVSDPTACTLSSCVSLQLCHNPTEWMGHCSGDLNSTPSFAG